jgi:DNA end-binding protein Ku
MLDLAIHIVETTRGEFEPQKFEDHYENALKELLRKKQHGERIERLKEPRKTNVVNLMDALRQSIQAERGGKRPAAASKKAPARSSGRKKAG